MEVYSIDESFLDLAGIRDRRQLSVDLSERVHQWTGIPNCIGIAPTKTLAKLANRVAKDAARKLGSYPAGLAGVCDLAALSGSELDAVLRATSRRDRLRGRHPRQRCRGSVDQVTADRARRGDSEG